jgi:hypothetical protein
LSAVQRLGIRLLKIRGSGNTWDAKLIPSETEPEFLRTAHIAEDPVRGSDGNIRGTECVARFKRNVSDEIGLAALKREGKTLLLLKRALKEMGSYVALGKRRFVSAYFKDLSSPAFQRTIMETVSWINPDLREKLVFKILGDRYGTVTRMAITNISWLKEHGFSIAMDGLCIDCEDDMSGDVFSILLEHEIVPDYVKLDRRHMSQLLE